MHARRVAATHGPSQNGHCCELTADSTTADILNKWRGNGHWTSAYLPLQENLGGEVGKGVLTGEAGCAADKDGVDG
jgi:hypothetical protein